MKLSIAEVNAMSGDGFVLAFGGVAEHSPWVARQAASARPFPSREAMIQAFADALKGAPRDAQLALLRAHPDLGARGGLSEESSHEQTGAGLGNLSIDERSRLSELNRLYRSKFGFPFILAVRGAIPQQILTHFAERVDHSAAAELAIALGEVSRIIRFRIEDRIGP